MAHSDLALRELVAAVLTSDAASVQRLLGASPVLSTASFKAGAMRGTANEYFIDEIKRYIYAGDTALHIAAGAYETEIVRMLIGAGSNVRARNRRGQEALHAAAVGSPGSSWWNPAAQTATIACLIEAGADPNALDKSGVAPLHRAVRTRCAAAVKTLIEYGADPALRNKSGSPAILLATLNTGRGGTGSQESKSQQQEILRLLEPK